MEKSLDDLYDWLDEEEFEFEPPKKALALDLDLNRVQDFDDSDIMYLIYEKILPLEKWIIEGRNKKPSKVIELSSKFVTYFWFKIKKTANIKTNFDKQNLLKLRKHYLKKENISLRKDEPYIIFKAWLTFIKTYGAPTIGSSSRINFCERKFEMTKKSKIIESIPNARIECNTYQKVKVSTKDILKKRSTLDISGISGIRNKYIEFLKKIGAKPKHINQLKETYSWKIIFFGADKELREYFFSQKETSHIESFLITSILYSPFGTEHFNYETLIIEYFLVALEKIIKKNKAGSTLKNIVDSITSGNLERQKELTQTQKMVLSRVGKTGANKKNLLGNILKIKALSKTQKQYMKRRFPNTNSIYLKYRLLTIRSVLYIMLGNNLSTLNKFLIRLIQGSAKKYVNILIQGKPHKKT